MSEQKILRTSERSIMERDEQQRSVLAWAKAAFATDGKLDEVEPPIRCLRFIEEALELAQAYGLEKSLILRQIDEVYSRPLGQVPQEVGGVGVTLMAFCESINLNVEGAILREIDRINSKPVEHFQARQKEKMAKGLAPAAEDKSTAELISLVLRAREIVDNMSPEELKAMLKQQGESYAAAEVRAGHEGTRLTK